MYTAPEDLRRSARDDYRIVPAFPAGNEISTSKWVPRRAILGATPIPHPPGYPAGRVRPAGLTS
jgi:hypothetical protein